VEFNDSVHPTTSELLANYAAILAELRLRKIVRSGNAPAGDYAELLVNAALGGRLVEHSSVKGHDLVLPDETTVQVKTRLVSNPPRRSQLQTSPFRSWAFTTLALVLLSADDYTVVRGVLIPSADARALSSPRAHVNGDVLMMTSRLCNHPAAKDITDALRAAASNV
jgi:hypothetical protein